MQITRKLRWPVLCAAAITLAFVYMSASARAEYFVTQWGGFGNSPGEFDSIAGVATDEVGNVYVADTFTHRVQRFDSSGTFLTQWEVYLPDGVETDSAGNVYVAAPLNVWKFTATGEFVTAFSRPGVDRFYAKDVAIDTIGNVYVADSLYDRIHKFAPSGEFITAWGRAGRRPGRFNMPSGVATDAVGDVYVSDEFNDRVQKFTSSGRFIRQWDVFSPNGLDTDSAGNVYVGGTSEITKFSSSGKFLSEWGRGGAGPGQFCVTYDVATDSERNVYVTDSYNRVQKFSPTRPTQPDGGGPGPAPGVTFGICNTSGVIKVRCAEDERFRSVEFGELIPVGCLVDARRGAVRVTAAQGGGRTQSGVFKDGLFRITQKDGPNSFVTLTLAGSLKCGADAADGGRAAASRRGRRLRSKASGRWRNLARASSVSTTSATWLVVDRCDGTTVTEVRKGTVTVRDFSLGQTVTVKAGQRYVAGR